MRRYFLYICFIGFITFKANGQDFKSDMMKISQTYGKIEKLSMEVNFSMYKTKTSTQASDIQEGKVRITKHSYYYKVGDIEIVKTSKLSLFANNQNKTILLGAPEKKGRKRRITDINVDSLSTVYKKVTYSKVSEKLAAYVMELKGGPYSEVRIEFNTETFFIEKIVMYFASPLSDDGYAQAAPRLEIIYSGISTQKPINENAFSEKKFLSLEKGKYKLKKAFLKYTFVNKLQK